MMVYFALLFLPCSVSPDHLHTNCVTRTLVAPKTAGQEGPRLGFWLRGGESGEYCGSEVKSSKLSSGEEKQLYRINHCSPGAKSS